MTALNRPKLAVILAGGHGTRMASSGGYLGLKPLTKIGSRPFLSYLLEYLCNEGIEEFLLLGGAKFEELERFSNSSKNDFHVDAIFTGEESDTAERLMACRYRISERIGSESFIFTYGDSIADPSLEIAMRKISAKRDEEIQVYGVACYNLPIEYGVIKETDGLITAFHEKTWTCPINAGFYILDKTIFDWVKTDKSFEKETLPRLANEQSLSLVSYEVKIWQGMDRASDLDKMLTALKNGVSLERKP